MAGWGKEYGTRPRLVDRSLLAVVLFEAGSGLVLLSPGQARKQLAVCAARHHGPRVVLLLVWKLRRVWKRVADRRRWDGATFAAVAALVFVLLAIGTGVVWTTAQWPLGYPNGMNWHVIFGLALALFVLLHMVLRYKPLRRADVTGRRAALSGLAVLVTGGVLWAVQNGAARAADLPGARRRFTGSKSAGAAPGLTYPITMWMFDNPAPYAADTWRLAVTGNVAHTLTLSAADLAQAPVQELTATLDCTGGWYTEQVWRGIPVAWVLEQAEDTGRHPRRQLRVGDGLSLERAAGRGADAAARHARGRGSAGPWARCAAAAGGARAARLSVGQVGE